VSTEPLPTDLFEPPPPPETWVPVRLEEALAATAMAAVALITFGNVLARYFTDFSFAFTEEYSIWLMVVMTFLGASAAVVRDRHMRITFVVERLPPRWRRRAETLSLACVLTMFLILAVHGARFAYDDYRFEVTSPALGLPQWLYTMWMPLLSAGVTARALGGLIRLWRGRPR
jgi:TRAP-type C4-dicarboxylate transport system permease small subunit